jgi:hypothetical protein
MKSGIIYKGPSQLDGKPIVVIDHLRQLHHARHPNR